MGSLSTTRADQSLAIGLGYLDGNNNVVDGANVEAGATGGIAIGRNANVAAGAAAGPALGNNLTATGDAKQPNNMDIGAMANRYNPHAEAGSEVVGGEGHTASGVGRVAAGDEKTAAARGA